MDEVEIEGLHAGEGICGVCNLAFWLALGFCPTCRLEREGR